MEGQTRSRSTSSEGINPVTTRGAGSAEVERNVHSFLNTLAAADGEPTVTGTTADGDKQMTPREFTVQRFSVISLGSFNEVVARVDSSIGHPDMNTLSAIESDGAAQGAAARLRPDRGMGHSTILRRSEELKRRLQSGDKP